MNFLQMFKKSGDQPERAFAGVARVDGMPQCSYYARREEIHESTRAFLPVIAIQFEFASVAELFPRDIAGANRQHNH